MLSRDPMHLTQHECIHATHAGPDPPPLIPVESMAAKGQLEVIDDDRTAAAGFTAFEWDLRMLKATVDVGDLSLRGVGVRTGWGVPPLDSGFVEFSASCCSAAST